MVHIAEIRLRKRVKPPQKLMWCVLRVAITFLTLEKLIWWILFPSNIINLQKNLPYMSMYKLSALLRAVSQTITTTTTTTMAAAGSLFRLLLVASLVFSHLVIFLNAVPVTSKSFDNTCLLDLLFIIIWLYWFRYVQESEA